MHVSSGELFSDCVTAVEPYAFAVGVNCTAPGDVSDLLRSARLVTTKPFVVYPNRGEVWNHELRRFESKEAEWDFGASAVQWYELGARLIGGCCRTTTEDISKIRMHVYRHLGNL
mmetsp:Transcript_35784/g.57867  ORF Transcript_35784/g.57867 Transcript_35784/m.57867 type:complete len:115 (+) Transcript_35784:362-706(+)